jgi:hypothetical protein
MRLKQEPRDWLVERIQY